MLKLILLVIDTLLCVRYLTWYRRGQKYSAMTENLSEKDYPAKDLYGVGLAAQEKGIFRFSGARVQSMVSDAALLYGKKYAEFYARIFWAQGITLALLSMTLLLSIACSMEGDELVFLLMAVVVPAVLFVNSVHVLRERLDKRRDECMLEFPDMISRVALLVNSGMLLREAWELVSRGREGPLYTLMQQSSEMMRNGYSESEALYAFAALTGAPEIRKFASVVVQGLEKGNRELCDSLVEQSAELWHQKRQNILQRGDKAAGKLLLPTGLLFVGVLIIVIGPVVSTVL